MEISYGLWDAGEFINVEYTVGVAFKGGLKMFAYACC
jgi:hypothetical protein